MAIIWISSQVPNVFFQVSPDSSVLKMWQLFPKKKKMEIVHII